MTRGCGKDLCRKSDLQAGFGKCLLRGSPNARLKIDDYPKDIKKSLYFQ